jgi:hypothetical protein
MAKYLYSATTMHSRYTKLLFQEKLGYPTVKRSRDSSVDIATGWKVRVRLTKEASFLFSMTSRAAPEPPNLISNGNPGVK